MPPASASSLGPGFLNGEHCGPVIGEGKGRTLTDHPSENSCSYLLHGERTSDSVCQAAHGHGSRNSSPRWQGKDSTIESAAANF